MSNYIYALLDENGDPFYVGKTNSIRRRSTAHRSEAKNGNPLPKYNKLRKLLAQGLDLQMEILECGVPPEVVDDREMHHIQRLKDEGYRLFNLTEGGDGRQPGYQHSEETKKKLSEKAKGREFSAQHKERLCEARRQRKTSPNTCRKMSASMKGRRNIKRYKLIDPSGQEFITTNGLTMFCEEHDLTAANLHKVLKGERPNHKGWRIEPCQ